MLPTFLAFDIHVTGTESNDVYFCLSVVYLRYLLLSSRKQWIFYDSGKYHFYKKALVLKTAKDCSLFSLFTRKIHTPCLMKQKYEMLVAEAVTETVVRSHVHICFCVIRHMHYMIHVPENIIVVSFFCS